MLKPQLTFAIPKWTIKEGVTYTIVQIIKVLTLCVCKQGRLRRDCTEVQADLSLCCLHIQDLHRLEKYLNLEGFLERSLKIKYAFWLSFVVTGVLLWVCYFPLWYPGSSVVLDCIDSWSLHPFLLWKVLENNSKALKSPWILVFSVGLNTVDSDQNQYKIVVTLFGAANAAPNKGTTVLY